jgi:uncharacterized protein YmfQ (DUF2313 family)
MSVSYTNPLDEIFRINGSKFDDAEDYGELLHREMYPDTTQFSLDFYERVYDIAYPIGEIPDDPDRQTRIIAAMRSRGGASRAYFIGIAATFGYTATITESTMEPFIVASTAAIATLLPGQLYDPGEQFEWTLTYDGTAHDYIFEHYIGERIPAHTVVTFVLA